MRRLMIPIIALSIAVVPATLTAQRTQRTQRPAAAARAQDDRQMVDPIQRILEHRSELGLTASQVSRIERVRTQLNNENKPLMTQLEAARPEGGARGMLPPQARARVRERLVERKDSVQNMTEEQRKELRARAEARRDSVRDNADTRRDDIRARADSLSPEERAKLREQLQGQRGGRPGGAMMGEKAEELRPVLEQVRDNTERALKQVEEILTPAQREKMRDLRTTAPIRRDGRQR